MFSKFLDWIIDLKIAFSKKEKETQKDIFKAFNKKLKALESVLRFSINNKSLYIKALTHRSFLEIEPKLSKSNERLEFLGDSVLGVIVAEYLFKNFLDDSEGFLTKARARLVNKSMLAEAANLINLKEYILFDKRYIKSSQKGMDTISADAMEALIGAIYLDAGLKKAENFVTRNIILPFINTDKFKQDENYKGQLLEYTHANKLLPPIYKLLKEEGPEHLKEFTIEVFIGTESYGIGVGRNKKTTEQEAAKKALEKVKNFSDSDLFKQSKL